MIGLFPFFIGKSNSILDGRKAKIWPSYLVESLVFATPGMAASHWIKVPQSVCDFAKTSIPVLAIHGDDDGLYWLFGGLLYMAFIFFLRRPVREQRSWDFFFTFLLAKAKVLDAILFLSNSKTVLFLKWNRWSFMQLALILHMSLLHNPKQTCQWPLRLLDLCFDWKKPNHFHYDLLTWYFILPYVLRKKIAQWISDMAYKRYFSNNLMEKSCALRFLLRTYLILNPINPLKRIAYTSCWAKVPNVIL